MPTDAVPPPRPPDQPPKRPDPPPAGAPTSKSGFDRYAATAGAGPGGGKVVVESLPVKKVDQQTGKTETIPTDKKTILPEVKVEGTKPAPAQVRAEASTFTKMVATAGDFLGRLMGEGKIVKPPGQPEAGSLRPNNPKDLEFPLLGEGHVERKPGAPEAGSTRQTDGQYAVRVGLEAGSALAPTPGSRAFSGLGKAEAKAVGAEGKVASAEGKAAAETKAAAADGKAAASAEGKVASAEGKAKPADEPTPAKPADKPAAAKPADGAAGSAPAAKGPSVEKPASGKPADAPASAQKGQTAGKPADKPAAAKPAVPERRNEASDKAAWDKAAADDKAAKGARPWARSDAAKAADKLVSVRASQGGVDKAASYKGGGSSGDAVKTGTPGIKEKVATADKGMSVKGSELREKGTRLPRDGAWDGKPGESNWVSRSVDVNDITHSRPVRFKDQAPELKPWAEAQVNLKKMTGDNAKDMPAARQDLMRQNPGRWDSAAHVERWEKGAALDNRGKGLAEPHTWHHEPDKETMTLVPRALHDGVQHMGGASGARAGQGPDRSTAPLDSNPH